MVPHLGVQAPVPRGSAGTVSVHNTYFKIIYWQYFTTTHKVKVTGH